MGMKKEELTNPNAKLSEEEFVGCIHCGLKIHFDQGETRHVLSGSIFCKKKHGMTLMEAEPKLKPKVNPRLRAEEGIGEARCPSCKTGRNSRSLGGNERCFHCDSCGFVNCIENCPDPTLNQSPEGKPTESAQQDEQRYERIMTVARHVQLSEDQVKRLLGCLLMIGLELTEVDPEAAPSTPVSAPQETPLRAILNHLRDEEADYLIGRCMPLLQILDENEQAIELLKDIRKYAFGSVGQEETKK